MRTSLQSDERDINRPSPQPTLFYKADGSYSVSAENLEQERATLKDYFCLEVEEPEANRHLTSTEPEIGVVNERSSEETSGKTDEKVSQLKPPSKAKSGRGDVKKERSALNFRDCKYFSNQTSVTQDQNQSSSRTQQPIMKQHTNTSSGNLTEAARAACHIK